MKKIADIVPMPWQSFGAGSGALTLHADPRMMDPLAMVDHFVMPDAVVTTSLLKSCYFLGNP